MILLAVAETDFRKRKISQQRWHPDHSCARRCFAKAFRSASIAIRRTEVRPFTDKQIALLEPSPTKP